MRWCRQRVQETEGETLLNRVHSGWQQSKNMQPEGCKMGTNHTKEAEILNYIKGMWNDYRGMLGGILGVGWRQTFCGAPWRKHLKEMQDQERWQRDTTSWSEVKTTTVGYRIAPDGCKESTQGGWSTNCCGFRQTATKGCKMTAAGCERRMKWQTITKRFTCTQNKPSNVKLPKRFYWSHISSFQPGLLWIWSSQTDVPAKS